MDTLSTGFSHVASQNVAQETVVQETDCVLQRITDFNTDISGKPT